MSKKDYDVFISYRREGGKENARNLTTELVSHGFHPFLDFDELAGKFDKRITDAIESAPVFLFILSPGALDRCVEEEDWVRKEILHAVKHNRHIVPVDIDNQFKGFPNIEGFPQIIKDALGQHQFCQIQTEQLYKVSIDLMVSNFIKPALDEYRREQQKSETFGAAIHIETDMDCYVQCHHKDLIVAKVEEENIIHLGKGKHKLQFIAVSNPKIKTSYEYKVVDIEAMDYIDVALKNLTDNAHEEELETLRKKNEELWSTVKSLEYEKKEVSNQLAKAKEEIEEKQKEIILLKDSISKELSINIKNHPVVKDKQNQIFKVGDIEFKMIHVEKGTFTMGATSEMKDSCEFEKPAHKVTVSSYFIGEAPVTQDLWKTIMGWNPSYYIGDKSPVQNISWDDCQDFIKKINKLTGKRFRLPTEAEWEFAARGGNKSQHTQYSGSNNLKNVAWCVGYCGNAPHPVMTKNPNELGLYDMSGNIFECCQDWFGDYSSSAQTNPTGPESGSYRVIRGGSWCDDAVCCRLSYRDASPPDKRSKDLGFRLALSE